MILPDDLRQRAGAQSIGERRGLARLVGSWGIEGGEEIGHSNEIGGAVPWGQSIARGHHPGERRGPVARLRIGRAALDYLGRLNWAPAFAGVDARS
ncbi:hypothetical protein GCM10011395_29150 [Sphingomonas psychrolutea]|uniref:Uncharacterized protein n=1 Tax=Sphingomonas psychrolutea TaxID=1259676 RepID=A0ABQ1H2W9_9SPHN|nr:hypothetical protein GCM10011395_29150 [Sphingomonas psychrolutea]